MFFNDDIYRFSVTGSMRHLMDLTIEPALRDPAIQFQIHLTKDNEMRVYWRKTILDSKLFSLIRNSGADITRCTSLHEAVCLPEVQQALLQEAPIESCAADQPGRQIVQSALNATLPPDPQKHFGYDGHHYFFSIYEPNPRTLACGCALPQEWDPLAPLITYLIQLAQLDPKCYGPI